MLLWEILAEQTIGVFIGAALPRRIGMGEVELELKCLSNLLMIGELLAVIGSQGVHLVCDRQEQLHGLPTNSLCRSVGYFSKHGEARFAFGQAEQDWLVVLAEEGVCLPVTEACSALHDVGTLFDTATIG